MNLSTLRANCRPHLWFQLYWMIYLIWFFWLDLTVKNPKYMIHSPIDDLIPFNEWFVFPYCSWFLLLAGVTALLWWCDTASYDKLCLMMFSDHEDALACGRLGQCLPIHPLPELRLHGTGVLAEQSGERPPGLEGAGMGLGWPDLRLHRVYQAALYYRCSLRSGTGGRLGAGALPPCKGKNVIFACQALQNLLTQTGSRHTIK